MLRLLATLLVLAVTLESLSGQKAESCNPKKCQLPNCFCGGTEIPGGLKPDQTPQFVLLTFDDAVNGLNAKFFDELFENRSNPNGCPMKVRTQSI
jgi:hypothetical protein